MLNKKFQRTIESFVCSRCGLAVKGTGYTDHCPDCLWSKHVDINPGDRLADCRGLMQPIGLEKKAKKYIIHYQCQKCGYQHRVKAAKNDNFDKLLELSSSFIN